MSRAQGAGGGEPASERRVVVGVNRGIVSTGDFATNIQADSVTVLSRLPPVTLVDAPPGFTVLPAMREFVGRTSELCRLDSILSDPAGIPATVIHGLGGQGKSALAAEWARTRWTVGPVRWIAADSEASLMSGLAAIAASLEPGIEPLTADALRERAVQWLASHPGWLLVLDNVTDRRDVDALVFRLRGQGKFLLTTLRATGWDGPFTTVALGDIHPDDAVSLFQRRAGLPEPVDATQRVDVLALCHELGLLALAVEQAGAYVAESGMPVAEYRGLLAARPGETYAVAAEGVDRARTVARVWSLALDRLADTPMAGDLLRVLAWFDGSGIPREFVTTGQADPIAVAEAIRRLAAHSLIRVESGGTISVHSLVQAVYRTPDPGDRHREGTRTGAARFAAIGMLAALVPADDATLPGTWPRWRMLLPHIEAVHEYARGEADAGIAMLLNAAATYLLSQGMTASATELLEDALAEFGELVGDAHELTLMCQSNLAHAYEDAGDLARAIPLYERTLAARERVLGEDDPATLASRASLASSYEAAGAFDVAIPMLERTLTDRQRVLGTQHRHTLMSKNNLAFAYEMAGKLALALPIFEQLLHDRVRVLGPKHPDTIVSRHNLALALESSGELDRAALELERALADAIEVLGPDHPQTLTIRDSVGHVRLAEGKLVLAIRARARALEGRERALGADHPDTLTSRNNLAHAYEAAGNLARAIPLYERTLADRERVLGRHHPHTLVSRNNVACGYEAAGDLERAIPLYAHVVADQERVLGDLHPSTLNTRVNLAYAHLRKGNLEEAMERYERVFRDHLEVFGAADERTRSISETLLRIRFAVSRLPDLGGGTPTRA